MSAVLVAGCGGGGGGAPAAQGSPVGAVPGAGAAPGTGTTPGTGTGTAPPVTLAGAWLTLTPASASLSVSEGESTAFRITGSSSKTFEKPFNMAVIDSKGVVAPDMTVTALSALEYAVDLRTAPALAAGTHTTTPEVRLCEDATNVCSKPLPGSPWFVPVTVIVFPPLPPSRPSSA